MRISHDTLFHVYMISFRRHRRFVPAGGGRSRDPRAVTPPARAVAFPRSGIGIVVIRGRTGRIPAKRSLITPRPTPRWSSRLRNAFGGRTCSGRSSTKSWTRRRATLCHHSFVHRSRPSPTFADKAVFVLDPTPPLQGAVHAENLFNPLLTLSTLNPATFNDLRKVGLIRPAVACSGRIFFATEQFLIHTGRQKHYIDHPFTPGLYILLPLLSSLYLLLLAPKYVD